jgi:hypothetical protein
MPMLPRPPLARSASIMAASDGIPMFMRCPEMFAPGANINVCALGTGELRNDSMRHAA